jgi:hypothetical protein
LGTCRICSGMRERDLLVFRLARIARYGPAATRSTGNASRGNFAELL